MKIRTDGTLERILKNYGLENVEWDDGLADEDPQ